MKTPEDEAFEDIERRQGGGFKAKQAMAADKVGPFEKWWYYEGSGPPQKGEDCEEHTKRMCQIAWSNGAYLAAQPAQEGECPNLKNCKGQCFQCEYIDAETGETCYPIAQPAQEPVECLDCGSNNVGIPATYDSLVNSVKSQPAQEPVAHLWECLGRWSAYLVCNGKQAECAPPSWLVEAIQNAITPPKREWVGLTDEDIERIKLMTYEKETNADGEEQEAVNIDWLIKTAEHFCKDKNNG